MRVSEGINFDHEAFNELMDRVEAIIEAARQLIGQNKALKEKLLLSAKEVAEMTGYSEKTIRVKKHEIGFVTMGKEILFKPADVHLWIERYYIKSKYR